MNTAAIARQFACPDPSKMRWKVEADIAECKGCPGFCGMAKKNGLFFKGSNA